VASLLSGDVDIPHVGKLPKIAVVLGVGGVIGLIIWQKHEASAAAASAAPAAAAGGVPGDPYPSDGTTGNPDDPYSLDPATGVTYGDEAAAGIGTGYGGYDVGDTGDGGGYGISAVTDAYPWDGTYSNTSDPYSMDPATGQTYGNEGTTGTSAGVTTGTGGPPFTTNAQWSQYVIQYFTADNFSDLAGMTTAIGNYLAGQAVTSLQQGYINDATAIAGQPPVAGPGNYPPSIRTSGSTASPTGPTSGAPATAAATAAAAPTVTQGKAIDVTTATAMVAWTGTGASQWQLTITGPGPINGKTSIVNVPAGTYGGLEANHNYEVSVQPLVNGKPAGKAGTITFKTT
jgi:hypothetical protein